MISARASVHPGIELHCGTGGCDERCLIPSAGTVGRWRRARRYVRTGSAVAAGSALVGAVVILPGHGRRHRAGWAVRCTARWVLAALEVDVHIVGSPISGPGLVVGNHVSFLDILVLSATEPMCMVAKSEIADWPLVGRLSRSVGTIDLDRSRLGSLPAAVAEMTAKITAGHKVQVFPEGTTRCGRSPGGFHRAGFQAAIDAARSVLPFTISYLQDGHPSTVPAFVGQENVLTCLRRVVNSPGLQVRLTWLPPIPAIPYTGVRANDRRCLAHRAERAVAENLSAVIGPAPGFAAAKSRAA